MRLATLVVGFATVGSAIASDVLKGWRTECVGRYQVSLPGDVEIALANRNDFVSNIRDIQNRFNDGVLASSSEISVNGTIYVNQLKHAGDLSAIRKEVDTGMKNLIKQFLAQSTEIDHGLQRISGLPDDIFGWMATGQTEQEVELFLGGTDYAYRYMNVGEKVLPQGMRFIKSFRPRTLFELPKEPGVCFPYGFIADDGKPTRHVAVTMRLREHPDVLIFFEDMAEGNVRRSAAAEHFGFGQESVETLEMAKLKNLWEKEAKPTKRFYLQDPGYHAAYLGGYKGTGSFVEITRLDGGTDYGYAAVIIGQNVSVPRLMVYVIRTAVWAKDAPMSKDDLKEIAIKIVASVKRRVVQ